MPTQMTSNEEKIREIVDEIITTYSYPSVQKFDKWVDKIMSVITNSLHSQKERVVEMCEDLKPDTEKYFSFADGYKLALSDLKTKIEEEL